MRISKFISLVVICILYSACTSVECNSPVDAQCDYYFNPRILPEQELVFHNNKKTATVTLANKGRIDLSWQASTSALVELEGPSSTGSLNPEDSVQLSFTLREDQFIVRDLGDNVQIVFTSLNHSATLELSVRYGCPPGSSSSLQGFRDKTCSEPASSSIRFPREPPCTSRFDDNSWRSIRFNCVSPETRIELFDDPSMQTGASGDLFFKEKIDGLCFNDLDTSFEDEVMRYEVTPAGSLISEKVSRICISNDNK